MMNHQDLPAFVKILSKTAKILIPSHQPDFEASHDLPLRKNNLFLRKQVSAKNCLNKWNQKSKNSTHNKHNQLPSPNINWVLLVS